MAQRDPPSTVSSIHRPGALACAPVLAALLLYLAAPASSSETPLVQLCPALWQVQFHLDGETDPRAVELCAIDQTGIGLPPAEQSYAADGGWLELKLRLGDERIDLIVNDPEVDGARWETVGLAHDESRQVARQGAPGPGAKVSAYREIPTLQHLRLEGTANSQAWLESIVDATGIELADRDLLPDEPMSFRFQAIPLIHALQSLTWNFEDIELWRLSDDGFRFVKVRDRAQLEELREEHAAALQTGPMARVIESLQAIRILGRLRGPDDFPPQVDSDTEWLAQLLESIGGTAEAIEVRREMLARMMLRDPRDDAPQPAEQRAALASLLFKLGQRGEATVLMAAARPVLDTTPDAFSDSSNIERYGQALWQVGELDPAVSALRQVLAAADAEASDAADWYRLAGSAQTALMAIAVEQGDADGLEALAQSWAVRSRAAGRNAQDAVGDIPALQIHEDARACGHLTAQLWRAKAFDTLPGALELDLLLECSLAKGDFAMATALAEFVLAVGNVGPEGGFLQEQARREAGILAGISRVALGAARNELAERIFDPASWPQAGREGGGPRPRFFWGRRVTAWPSAWTARAHCTPTAPKSGSR